MRTREAITADVTTDATLALELEVLLDIRDLLDRRKPFEDQINLVTMERDELLRSIRQVNNAQLEREVRSAAALAPKLALVEHLTTENAELRKRLEAGAGLQDRILELAQENATLKARLQTMKEPPF